MRIQLSCLLFAGAALAHGQNPDPRVMATTVSELEKELGFAVNYEDGSLPGGKVVDVIEGRLFVIPAGEKFRVLETPVSFWYQERSVGETIDLILGGVSKAGRFHVGSNGPPMMMITTKVFIGATNEPARNVLARVLVQLGPGAGYQLLCDNSIRECALNIHTVPAI